VRRRPELPVIDLSRQPGSAISPISRIGLTEDNLLRLLS
jgi:hypothetical protein